MKILIFLFISSMLNEVKVLNDNKNQNIESISAFNRGQPMLYELKSKLRPLNNSKSIKLNLIKLEDFINTLMKTSLEQDNVYNYAGASSVTMAFPPEDINPKFQEKCWKILQHIKDEEVVVRNSIPYLDLTKYLLSKKIDFNNEVDIKNVICIMENLDTISLLYIWIFSKDSGIRLVSASLYYIKSKNTPLKNCKQIKPFLMDGRYYLLPIDPWHIHLFFGDTLETKLRLDELHNVIYYGRGK